MFSIVPHILFNDYLPLLGTKGLCEYFLLSFLLKHEAYYHSHFMKEKTEIMEFIMEFTMKEWWGRILTQVKTEEVGRRKRPSLIS